MSYDLSISPIGSKIDEDESVQSEINFDVSSDDESSESEYSDDLSLSSSAYVSTRECCDKEEICKPYNCDNDCKNDSLPSFLEVSAIESGKKKCKDVKKHDGPAKKGKKFMITFQSKRHHPWAEYNHGVDSIHINGKNGPALHVKRGETYFFCVEPSDGHALILTDSPSGGLNSRIVRGGFGPLEKGCVCIKIEENAPKYFFYQDSKHAFAGGLIVVH